MGKFFLVGVLLGGAIAGTAVYFVYRDYVSEATVQQRLLNAKEEGKEEGKKEERATLTAEHAKAVEATKQEHAVALARKDEETARAREQAIKAEAQVGALTQRTTALAGEMTSLSAELRVAQSKLVEASTTNRPKQLLASRRALDVIGVELWRTLAEAVAVLRQAQAGWPNVQAAQRAVGRLDSVSGAYVKAAQEVRAFIENHSKELTDALGDLAVYRAGATDVDVDALVKLAAAVSEAVKGMGYSKVEVSSEAKAWTDTEVFAKKGDTVHVRAEGAWTMTPSWQRAGPEGWEGGGQYKVAADYRVGSLIMCIGTSERVHPGYLGKPIEAEENGRVKFLMNDKDMLNNRGSVTAEVASASPDLVAKALAAWQKATGK